MHTITYVSSAITPFSQDALLALLQKSRENNARFGITGMLLYASGNFMQAIEGPEESVFELFSNIRRDPAHRNILTLVNEPISERNFAHWQMGFIRAGKEDLSSVSGFCDIFRHRFSEEDLPVKPSPAKNLLFTFRQSAR